MVGFNATVLALIAGIVIGTVLRPGLLEVAIVGALVYAVARVGRPKRRQTGAERHLA
ncbi:hypothetical protein R5W23_006085 [Gemmata sp. JC673]|uniref:Uncharacterized protein n=1 Tax=Gemmata algarum TaxID=2975278 RepID=A0ABU5EUJ4_9BACT|nr:hypothetical protein [Gemmata algarum]MDY3558909.1 hypothetical protein [Gemmata algarum]